MLLHESCNCMQWQQPCMQQAIQGFGSRMKEMLVGQELLGRLKTSERTLESQFTHCVLHQSGTWCTPLEYILNVQQSPYPLLPPKQPWNKKIVCAWNWLSFHCHQPCNVHVHEGCIILSSKCYCSEADVVCKHKTCYNTKIFEMSPQLPFSCECPKYFWHRRVILSLMILIFCVCLWHCFTHEHLCGFYTHLTPVTSHKSCATNSTARNVIN